MIGDVLATGALATVLLIAGAVSGDAQGMNKGAGGAAAFGLGVDFAGEEKRRWPCRRSRYPR